MRDVTDAQLARIIVIGSIIGMVALFVVTFVIGVLAGASPGEAAAIAIIPTFFGGWFYGGTGLLLKAAYGEKRADDAREAAERAEPHDEVQRQAA
jgi:Na+/citrate or Na+/malate symporter